MLYLISHSSFLIPHSELFELRSHLPPAANMPRLNLPLGKPADAVFVRQPPVLTRCAAQLDPDALLVRREPCLDVVRTLTHFLNPQSIYRY